VNKPAAFWDSSALLPLCVREASSRRAQTHLRKLDPVVWWGSLVEIHSAICRLHRAKQITDANKQGALARLRLLSSGWREILPDDELRDLAMESLDKYHLRAADGMQLAASLIWCKKRPSKRNFVCADQRLSEAARAAGFSLIQIVCSAP
jgi:predicted nucleic acid-binding protein